jgi:hypothetical protein
LKMRLKMVTVAMVCGVVAATATAALAEGKDQGERFVVTGVMVLANGKGLAWLQEPKFTGDRPVLVRAGERIGPYQVTAVLEDRVELEGPNGRVLVPLRNANGAPAVGSATPNASAAGPAVVPPTKHVPRGRELHRLEMEARRLQRREQSGPAQEGQSQSPQSEKRHRTSRHRARSPGRRSDQVDRRPPTHPAALRR